MIRSKVLSKKYKGGGGDVQTVSSVPDWAVPYLQNVGNQAEGQYQAGNLGRVAQGGVVKGVNPLLDAAFGSGAGAIADKTNQGLNVLDEQQDRLRATAQSGPFDTSALKDNAILEAQMKTANLGKQYGASGTLGSARQAVQQGAQNAATSAQFAEIDRASAQQDFQNRQAAEQGISGNVGAQSQLATGAAQAFGTLGQGGRKIEQETMDADWQALQRYASTIYGNTARQQAVAGGGGK
jgi:hypothetical protein